MSASSSTVHTCTSQPGVCAWRMKRGETTRIRPAVLGHLIAAVRRTPHRPAAPATDTPPAALRLRLALVAISGQRRARGVERQCCPYPAAHTRSTAPAARTSSATACPIAALSTFISMMMRHVADSGPARRAAPGCRRRARGTESRRDASAKRQPASTRASSAAVSARTGPDRARSSDRACRRDRRPRRRPPTGARRARGRRRRRRGPDRTPRSCFPGRARSRRGARTRAAAKVEERHRRAYRIDPADSAT